MKCQAMQCQGVLISCIQKSKEELTVITDRAPGGWADLEGGGVTAYAGMGVSQKIG